MMTVSHGEKEMLKMVAATPHVLRQGQNTISKNVRRCGNHLQHFFARNFLRSLASARLPQTTPEQFQSATRRNADEDMSIRVLERTEAAFDALKGSSNISLAY